MTEIVCAGTVEDIASFIADCRFPPETLFLLEQLPQQVITGAKKRWNLLRFTYFEPDLPFTDYTSGRIFHPTFELHWEKNNRNTQVVYVGTAEYRPSLLEDATVDLNAHRTRHYYLWGERLRKDDLDQIGKPAQEGDFAEVRIPRLLRYPDRTEARRLQLTVREYVDEKTGKVNLFRFQNLEPAKERA